MASRTSFAGFLASFKEGGRWDLRCGFDEMYFFKCLGRMLVQKSCNSVTSGLGLGLAFESIVDCWG